jgi:trehalose synthase
MVAFPPVTAGGLARLVAVLDADRAAALHCDGARIRSALSGRTLWHVNSTAAGGGVAEMLRVLLPIYAALDVDARWAVVEGDTEFFGLTKRLGLALYGSPGDGGPLGPAERDRYLAALRPSADALVAMVRPGDVVVLHDHQTAGLVPALARAGARVFWRCHVGVDQPTAASDNGWSFVAPLLDDAHGLFFSVPWHVPRVLRNGRAVVLPPFISPSSPKNRDLTPQQIERSLARCGLWPGASASAASVVAEAPPGPDVPLVTQVSRWDELKDMDGVLSAFADHVPLGYLALVGPDPAGVPDDTAQAQWFDRCRRAWHALSPAKRRRVALVCLPMSDLTANALLVNAIQRASAVVLQKSLAEGFGLTVTEAMWKRRPVVASAVGGIRSQIDHGSTGFLTDDPHDRAGFGALVMSCLSGDVDTAAVGDNAHDRVLNDFLPDREIRTMARVLA